jgi:hypothetical protein
MTEQIKVISAEIDGAELRREQIRNPYHARCDGRGDDAEINEALGHVGVSRFTIPGDRWEQIFGGIDGRR